MPEPHWWQALDEARRDLEDYGRDYNERRPHSSFADLVLWEYVASLLGVARRPSYTPKCPGRRVDQLRGWLTEKQDETSGPHVGNIMNRVKSLLPEKAQKLIRKTLRVLKSHVYSHDLSALSKIFGTDKWGSHWYAQHYQKHFAHLRRKKLNILEIGVGGYKDPQSGGASLRMWKRFFPKSKIYSIDIYDKSVLEERRIRMFKGSQADDGFLRSVVARIGSLDIVIDDGSHINDHVVRSFQTLFPLLNPGGIYVVEDTQTSYWPEWGGDSDNLRTANTIMNSLKDLTDGLNHKEFVTPGYIPTFYDLNIVSLHFYHNLVFIYKGSNDEASTRLFCSPPN